MKLPLDRLRHLKGKAADSAGGAPDGKKKKRRKRKKPVVIAAAAVVLIGGAAVFHHASAAKKNDAAQNYIEATAARQDIQTTLSATGTIQPANQYNVTSSVQGDVLSCTFEEGDTVKRAIRSTKSTRPTPRTRSTRRSSSFSRAATATTRRRKASRT